MDKSYEGFGAEDFDTTELSSIFESERVNLEKVGKHLRLYFEAKDYTEAINKLLENTKNSEKIDERYAWKIEDN